MGILRDNDPSRRPRPAARPSDAPARSARPGRWERLAAAGVVGLLSATTLLTTPAATPAVFAQQPATVDDILDEPAGFYGQAVSVVGPIDEVVGAHAFTIENLDDLFSDELLVVSADRLADIPGPGTATVEELEDIRAWVAGTARPFALADVERELGIDLDDGLFADWEGRPAIVAHTVELIPGVFDDPLSDPVAIAPAAPVVAEQATVDEILDDPTAFYGERVTVSGEVGERLGALAFTVEDGDLLFDEHILVIGAPVPDGPPSGAVSPLVDLDGAGDVVITGQVRPFVLAEVERDLGYDFDDAIFADWEGAPALIAAEVTPIDPAPAR